jgi:hypothetical protein
MKLIFIVICIVMILPIGCDSLFTWDEEIELGQLNNIKDGRLLAHVELKHTVNGWHIVFGDPEEYEEIRKIDNHVLNQKLIVSITNKNDVELTMRSNEGLVKIPPNNKKIWYHGTLSDLIFKARSIQTSHYYGPPCKFDIEVEFDNKEIIIDIGTPIRITASWSDSL